MYRNRYMFETIQKKNSSMNTNVKVFEAIQRENSSLGVCRPLLKKSLILLELNLRSGTHRPDAAQTKIQRTDAMLDTSPATLKRIGRKMSNPAKEIKEKTILIVDQ